MKRYFLILLLSCIAAMQATAQQAASRVTLDPQIPVAGRAVAITYDPAGGPLEGLEGISATIHMFNDYSWQSRDLRVRQQGGVCTVTYELPADCAFFALGFAVKDEYNRNAAYDNNDDQGFVYMVNNADGRYMPGTALAWGIFRKPSLGKGVYGYFSGFEISDEAAMMWIFKEAQTYGQNMPRFFESFMAGVRMADEEEFPQAVEEIVPQFLAMPGITEKSYLLVENLYRIQMKNTAKADSMERVILEKYPRGERARFIANRNATQNMTVASLEGFLAEFPLAEWQRQPEQANQEFLYYNTYRSLITGLMAEGMYDRACDYAGRMYFKALNETYRWNIEGQLKNPTLDFTPHYPVADAYIRQMIAKVGDGTMQGYDGVSSDRLAQMQLNARLSAHIRLLDRLGRYGEAIGFLQYVSPEERYSDPDLNEAYVNALEHTGTQKELKEFLEAAYRANAVTPGMLAKLEQAYVATNGSTEGYDAYLGSLKPSEELEEIRRQMLGHIIDVPYAAFSLENPDLNMVNSADWGDRVVILDFWGTWCYPCIKAFPGMQMAVDKYRDDPAVGFYFISTDDTVESVERFIGRNNYTFNWLYDLETGRNDKPGAVYRYFRELLDVSGVPCKVAVRGGRVRYVSIGYGGSPSRLADELSVLIEILKEL